MKRVRFDHCVIHVTAWDRSSYFYRDVLGAEIVRAPSGWCFRFGNGQLNVHGSEADPSPLARVPVEPGGSDLCFEWPGPIEEAAVHLETHDVPVEAGPVQRFGARGPGMSVYFRDPDGSLVEFISYAQD